MTIGRNPDQSMRQPRRYRIALVVVGTLVLAAGLLSAYPAVGTLTAGPGAGTVVTVDPSATRARPAPTATFPPPPRAMTTQAPRPTPGRSAATQATHTAKKGVSTWDFVGAGEALSDVRVSWYYNWSPRRTAGAAGSVEFVPMIWGASSVTPSTLGDATAAGTTILGFNEPDLAGQANMTVEQALDLWPQLQATGRRLGSPAVAYGGDTPGGWLDRFMSGAGERHLRVDFIALHWYGSDFSPAAAGQLQRYLAAVHDRYHLPIWLTEFALIKFDGGTTLPTTDQQVAFIGVATTMLNQLSYVERYAWFALPLWKDQDGTGLYRDADTPTALGAAYRAVS